MHASSELISRMSIDDLALSKYLDRIHGSNSSRCRPTKAVLPRQQFVHWIEAESISTIRQGLRRVAARQLTLFVANEG